MIERVDVAIVGGGQAGLAAAKSLGGKAVSVVVLEAESRLGHSWRSRYEGLTLFTPRTFNGLSGMSMRGDPQEYPDKDEFAGYLEEYAQHHRLPVSLNCRVDVIARDDTGGFLLTLEGGTRLSAASVVVAVGAFRNPIRPAWAALVPPDVPTVDAEAFSLDALPKGDVLVVGDGASGRDIAMLARGKHGVTLATGRSRRLMPEHIAGKSLWWWLRVLGLLRAGPRSLIGRFMRRSDPFPDRKRRLRDLVEAGVDICPRAVGFQKGRVVFADGREIAPTAIVWALGYRPDWSFLKIPGALDARGQVLHDKGVSPVERLYFVGLPWQRNRASGLVMGVSEDAEIVADQLLRSVTKS